MNVAWKARPTVYRGISMRSRLEATVAAELDAFECEWTYEPRAYANEHGQYLPDFQLLGINGMVPRYPTFMEVRPTVERAYMAMVQMAIIWDSEPDAQFIIRVPNECDFFNHSGTRKWVVLRPNEDA